MRLTANRGKQMKKIQNRNKYKYRKCKRILRVTTLGAFRKSPACSKRAHQFSQLHLIAPKMKSSRDGTQHNTAATITSTSTTTTSKAATIKATRMLPIKQSQLVNHLIFSFTQRCSLVATRARWWWRRLLASFSFCVTLNPPSPLPDDAREYTINFVYCSQNRCNSQPERG